MYGGGDRLGRKKYPHKALKNGYNSTPLFERQHHVNMNIKSYHLTIQSQN